MAQVPVSYKTTAKAELSPDIGETTPVISVVWEKTRNGLVSFVQGENELLLSPKQLDDLKDLVITLINDTK